MLEWWKRRKKTRSVGRVPSHPAVHLLLEALRAVIHLVRLVPQAVRVHRARHLHVTKETPE
ncbi:hypothetical protein ANCDUO_18029, partial [Ancylostoma duodenale]